MPPLTRLLADPGRAIGEHTIVCLICGVAFRWLTDAHLRTHATAASEYRMRFGYTSRRLLMCEALRRRYREGPNGTHDRRPDDAVAGPS
jgi:hypothetical protein